MEKLKEAERKFIQVRDTLLREEEENGHDSFSRTAYRFCWKKNYRFYAERTVEQAIACIKKETEEYLKGVNMRIVEYHG